MPFAFKATQQDGRFVFPQEGVPLVVKLLEDLGQVEAVGKFGKNEQGEQRYWEAFRVVVDGKEKILPGTWRLRAALKEALVKSEDLEPTVAITMTYKTEKLKNGNVVAIKNYHAEERVPF